jgi:hypothetical protein
MDMNMNMNIEVYKPDEVKPMNIYDLYRGIQQKKMKRIKSYDTVLSKCYAHIQKAADTELFQTFFEVPVFIVGLPLYDLNHCTAYIITQLRNNGFLVTYYFPRILYISWEIKEIRDKKEKAHERGGRHMPDTGLDDIFTHTHNERTQQLPFTRPNAHTQEPIMPPYQGDTIAKRSPFPAYATKFKPNGKFVINL